MKSKLRVLLPLLALLALPALAPLAAQTTPAVVSYTLVNADTDLDIQPLASGAVLDLATLPTRNLNIRANTSPAAVGSVRLSLSGAAPQNLTENVAPYALFSDLNGNYFAWVPPLGAYALTATPYAGADGSGAAGTPLAVAFTVINSAGSVVSYTLVNADTDLDIQPLASGAVLNLATLPTRNLNIRANINPLAVGSVNFALSGMETHASTENVVPYALFSNLNGDYFAWTPAVGTYALTATPYKAIAGGGLAGLGLSISFVVTDSGPLPVVLTAFTAAAGAGQVALRWATASETNNREFVVERGTDGQHFVAVGSVAGAGNCLTARAYAYDDNVASLGAVRLCYRLRQVDFAGAVSYSPVRTVAVAGLAAAFTVFPTLATGGQVEYACAGPLTGTEVVELFSLQGQRCGRYSVAAGGLGTVPVAGLAPGTYLLRLISDQGRSSQRFVVP